MIASAKYLIAKINSMPIPGNAKRIWLCTATQ